MANICDNKFFFQCNKNYTYYLEEFRNRIGLEEHKMCGEITCGYENNSDDDFPDGGWLEGYFESNWNFPIESFKDLFDKEDGVYFRCLSEEYGCGYVALNVFSGFWYEEQTFDL